MMLPCAQIERLFHQYRDELMRRLRSMVSCHDTAADLMQETFIRLLRVVETQSVEHPRALLHRTATNLAIDYLRTQRNALNVPEQLEASDKDRHTGEAGLRHLQNGSAFWSGT